MVVLNFFRQFSLQLTSSTSSSPMEEQVSEQQFEREQGSCEDS